MNPFCLRVERVSKHFQFPERKPALFEAWKSVFRQRSLYGRFYALKDVSFEVARGERVALIGENGSGKTTLLRILLGIYRQNEGRVFLEGSVQGLFHFFTGMNEGLSVQDNVFLFGAFHGMSRKYLREKMETILEDSGLWRFRYSSLKDLSKGQKQRLALSVFFQAEGDLVIIDEALAFLDEEFMRKFDAYALRLQERQATVLFSSHDAGFLRRYCQRAIWLEEGRLKKTGNVDEVLFHYEKNGQRGKA